MPKAIVIGGGFGGMAAALRLRKKGYEVTLIDKGAQLGGRATQYPKETEHGTFIHDAGPTVITAKFLFDELFELFGKKREDYVEFRDIYPWYRIVFAGQSAGKGDWLLSGQSDVDNGSAAGPGKVPVPFPGGVREGEEAGEDVEKGDRHLSRAQADGSSAAVEQGKEPVPFFDYGGTLEEFEAQIRKFGGEEDVLGFRKYLAHSKKIFDVGFTKLGDQPFDKFTTMLKCAPDLVRLGCYRTVWQMGKKYIRNDLLRRVFSFQPLLVGGNPFNTTSIYSLIFYLERQWGVQFAMGGTGAIVRGLQKLMEEEGIEIRLNCPAIQLDTRAAISGIGKQRDKRWGDGTTEITEAKFGRASVHGALVDPFEQLDGDVVICNGDPPHVYKNLVIPEHRPKWTDAKIDALKYSMGLFVLYFGTTRQYPDVAHHTIVLGEAYKELLEKIFDKHELEREDLSVYLHRPTATDPSMAPAGMDSFYVLVPVPNLKPRKGDWLRSRQDDDENPDAAKKGTVPVPFSSGEKSTDGRDGKGYRHVFPADAGRRSSDPDGENEPVPFSDDATIDWQAFGDTFKQDVIRYLERTVLPGLSECITGEFYVTPDHFRDNLNTQFGTGFSIQPIFKQSAWFRFHNKSEDIDGLYFVGQGTHPGAGMPGVLCSAKVLDRLIPEVGSR